MPMRRFKPEQIVTLLRQIEVEIANGKTTPQACRDAQITVQTFYRWRKEYGGLKLDQAKRLKDLEKENSKLKRLEQQACIHSLRTVALNEASQMGIKPRPANTVMYLFSDSAPPRELSGKAIFLSSANRAIKSNPTHHFRVCELESSAP
jgi:putative transposase